MKLYVYSGTHWDREWYQSFQGFRHRLVDMADKLVDGLERREDYKVFHFDGQTVVLEDILEIAPDLEERLGKQIREGRIQIGPWYCMPDEFLVSGESLIRNLQYGQEICRRWGVEGSKNGYICDIFGHIAQMPQIFDGMDIHHAVLGRGTNAHTTPMHFRWQSPDGTDVRVFKVHNAIGYGDFTHFVAKTTDPQADGDVETYAERAKEYVDERISYANIPVILLLDAMDHNHWHEDTPKYVEALKKLYPEAEVIHGDIMDFCRDVDAYMDRLPFVAGELNEPHKDMADYGQLITNVLSSRYDLKLQNDLNQIRLEKIIQPLNAYGKTLSRPGFLKLAQKYLLQNQPHDSICGCSIDQVHRDMHYRFDQTRLLCDEIENRVKESMAKGSFALAVTASADAEDALILRLYNPLPYRYTGAVEAEIRFPKDFPKYKEQFGYEKIAAFKLYDADGREVPYGIRDIEVHDKYDLYRVTLQTALVPSGLTDLEIRPSSLPTRYLSSLCTDTFSAENAYIRLEINGADGSVSLTDKENGRVYPKLLTLLDNGEIGDGWYHCSPKIDRTVAASLVSVEKCEDTVNAVTFKINLNLRLPVACDRHSFGTRRSEETVDCPVTHYVTLREGERALLVKTVVDNKACDHRLKLRLGTGVEGKTYYASQAFAMIERSTDLIPDTEDWMECAIREKATEGIVAKFGQVGGFAFMAKAGLHECAVFENGNMDITLLRCFKKTVRTEGEVDGQLLGKHTFEYALMPIDQSRDSSASLLRKNDMLRAGILTVTATGKAGQRYEEGLAIEQPGFVFSTANATQDGFEFRFFNASDKTETGVIRLPVGAKSASTTYLDGRVIEELAVENDSVTVTAGKWKIVTVRVKY